MKQPGDFWKVRYHDVPMPKPGDVVAVIHKRTGQITRKAQVMSTKGRTVHLVIVPLDTPHGARWLRR